MLVLSRKNGEAILIGDDSVYDGEYVIKLSFELKGDKIRVGIDAPFDLKIIREELVGTKSPREVIATDGPAITEKGKSCVSNA